MDDIVVSVSRTSHYREIEREKEIVRGVSWDPGVKDACRLKFMMGKSTATDRDEKLGLGFTVSSVPDNISTGALA